MRPCAVVAALLLGLLPGCAGSRAFSPSPAPVDIAIVTILEEEYRAALGQLDDHRPVPSSPTRANIYRWVEGTVETDHSEAPYRVVVAMAGEYGEVSGALTTRETIARWRPRAVMVVGIGGGIEGRVALGDVVIPEAIWGYDVGHLGNRFTPRARPLWEPDEVDLQAAARTGATWAPAITVAAPRPGLAPAVVAGRVGSGNKVIEGSSSRFFEDIMRAEPGTIAVEMEGIGAVAAVRQANQLGQPTRFFMVRAISDLIGPSPPAPPASPTASENTSTSKNPERAAWKTYSATVAAMFAIELIRDAWPDLPRRTGSGSGSTRPRPVGTRH